mgnify:CR=1 FL=1
MTSPSRCGDSGTPTSSRPLGKAPIEGATPSSPQLHAGETILWQQGTPEILLPERYLTTEEQDEWGEGVSALVLWHTDGTADVYPGDRTEFYTDPDE